MAHKFFDANCTVYIWRPIGMLRGTIGSGRGWEGHRVGHGAIQVSDGGSLSVYLSYWPEHAPVTPGLSHDTYMKKVRAQVAALPDERKATARTAIRLLEWAGDTGADGDADHEQTKPTIKYRFTHGLKWTEMANRAFKLKGETKQYDIRKNNCCHAVAHVLQSGEPEAVPVPMKGWVTNVWQPGDVESYCEKLMAWSNEQVPGSARRKGEGGWSG